MVVALLLKRNKPEAVTLAREVCEALAQLGAETWVALSAEEVAEAGLRCARAVAAEELAHAQLLVVLGGDGTLLYGADLVADHGVPILGINLGNLGFLTSCPPELGRATLERALGGSLPVERRMRLEVELVRANGERVVRRAVNDAVISQAGLARLIEFDTFLDGSDITTYRADGLIIATPTGSTAYSLAAGGPILTPALDGMVLCPICPHTLTNRALVVPSSSRMWVQLRQPTQHVVLTIDGHWATPLEQGDRVVANAAAVPLLLHRPADMSYFDILRTKLHWGERMGHATSTDGRR
jgi:NAD+ kinase